MAKLYDKNSIESLEPLEFTRLRPQVYVGDCTYATQLLVEIISNSIDEFRVGHGNIIKVNIDNATVTVSDEGQGFIPNFFREDGKTILESAFSVLNTSGKYREDGSYEGTSLGSYGIGAKLATFLSHFLNAKTYRDGLMEEILFEEGVFKERKVENCDKSLHGTIVTWEASGEFFTNPTVEINKVRELFKTLVALCPGLKIVLTQSVKEEEIFYSKNGISDLADAAVGDKEIINNRFIMNYTEGKNKLDLVMTYTSNYSSSIVPYVNAGLTESGQHITQLKTILTREMNKFFKEKKWLKDKDDNLSGDDINEGLYLVFNITTSGVAYDAQVKSRVSKIDMKPFTSAFAESLNYWLHNNEKEIKILADKAIGAKKAREAAKKAREAARKTANKTPKSLKAKLAISDKFVDCKNKNPKDRNLLLVEGLSAGGSAIEARNVETDCIYMLRGKVLSVLKCTQEKVFANQELSDIISIIGAGFGSEFKTDKMNFDKIVITTDQDSDGFNIELLLITFFYTYMKDLVLSGKLYRAVTPLYIVTTGKEKNYCYSEKDLSDWKAKHPNVKYELSHAKGLGELDAETLKEVCFQHQRYKRITVSDAEKAEKLLETLMGSKIAPRKQYIYDNATELGFNFL